MPLQSDKSVAKDMPRVETFSDSTVCSSAAGFAMRTRSGILRPNRSARRRSVRVMGTTFSPLRIREPWNQIDMPGLSRHEDALQGVVIFRRARMAELADAPDSKSGGRKAVWVRPPLRAPNQLYPVYSISPQNTHFCFIRLQQVAEPILQKALKIAYFAVLSV